MVDITDESEGGPDGQEDASLQEGQELDEGLEGEISGFDEGADEVEDQEEGLGHDPEGIAAGTAAGT